MPINYIGIRLGIPPGKSINLLMNPPQSPEIIAFEHGKRIVILVRTQEFCQEFNFNKTLSLEGTKCNGNCMFYNRTVRFSIDYVSNEKINSLITSLDKLTLIENNSTVSATFISNNCNSIVLKGPYLEQQVLCSDQAKPIKCLTRRVDFVGLDKNDCPWMTYDSH